MTEDEGPGANLGIVVIGRNEGERLANSLRSVHGRATLVVYVDSGSTDHSVSKAKSLGVCVVELDERTPFTAARARNAGFDHLRRVMPDLRYVQFVDGDCEVAPEWLKYAIEFLDAHRNVAVVCGRRRERYPAQSIYNTLCDIEWNKPIGEAKACGGDALMRADAFDEAGRYRADMIAGEEPELCVRLRRAGWQIWCIDCEMTLHDAAMTRFSQWWRRALRGGYAYAKGAYLHGSSPERHCVWEARRAWLWGFWLPLACLVAGLAFEPWGWAMWLIYPLQVLRQVIRNRGSLRKRSLQALFQVLAHFAEAWGQIKFLGDRLFGSRSRLIEYK